MRIGRLKSSAWTLALAATALFQANGAFAASVVAEGVQVEKVGDGYKFTEGPAADVRGDVYFTDIPNNRIHKWSPVAEEMTVFREDSGGANGLYVSAGGTLYVCEGGNGRLAVLSPDGKQSTPLAQKYDGKSFNKPNDLWIDPAGGVYFTDPNYGRQPKKQDGEHVYYRSPDGKKVIRVADDFVRPNGIIGTVDGKTLYIADHGGGKTFRYAINPDGTLKGKTLFAETGSDGMTLDQKGNLYVTTDAVQVYSPQGKLIETIEVPERPSNVCFGGPFNKTLFITARTGFYALEMAVKGMPSVAGAGTTDKDGVFHITIATVQEMMIYDIKRFTVTAGQKVKITFRNDDFPPHNLLVVKPGTADEVASLAIDMGADGFAKGFRPDTPKILFGGTMIDFEASELIEFVAPKQPGDYPYVCTFPGHAPLMRGMMHVVAP
ncbi:MAG: SMP-30/gluconolactonase/LRE family protein [Phycisphaerae bacterium]|nr:SMP-30/gluconolactonase/LRE family protein [Phycisphaerae bacterium]